MTDKNIQMSQRNATNDGWDNLFPKTKAANVVMADATTVEDKVTAHLAESAIQTAGGTASAIVITTGGSFDYTQGNRLSFKAVADNTGNMTISADGGAVVPFLKLDSTQIPAGGIKNGKVYDVYYDSASGGRFFLLARASGTAVAGDVLAGKTFSNDSDSGLAGTMPNKVGSATVITPGTADIAIPQGYYGGALTDGKVKGDTNLIAASIIPGKTIFGVAGSAPVKKYSYANPSGTRVPKGGGSYTFSGLPFVPKTIAIAYDQNGAHIGFFAKMYLGAIPGDQWNQLNDLYGYLHIDTEPTGTSFTVTNPNASYDIYIYQWTATEQLDV